MSNRPKSNCPCIGAPVNFNAEVEQVIRQWKAAIVRTDMDAILEAHGAVIRMFDVPEPLEVEGLAAYRATWDLFFRRLRDPRDRFIIEQIKITASAEVAFGSGLLRIGGSAKPVCRFTLRLERRNGAWVIVHEHHSMPHRLEAPEA